MFLEKKNSRNQSITFSDLPENITLDIKREDELHPFVSGNKYRKLTYNLLEAFNNNHQTIVTFGGAFSNHIAATAAAGKEFNFKTIGVIRGDELGVDLNTTLQNNPTLKFAYENGMKFYFISRETYRQKTSASFIEKLKSIFGTFYLVPEGGTNTFAVKGCEEILTNQDKVYDYICTAVGTGGTISGIINSSFDHQKVIGFPALKGDFLKNDISNFVLKDKNNWIINNEYHFGGYAKITEELITFINKFKSQTGVQLDPIYTGKMMFGIIDLAKKGYFKSSSKILAIHTGGLQGIDGMNNLLEKKGITKIYS